MLKILNLKLLKRKLVPSYGEQKQSKLNIIVTVQRQTLNWGANSTGSFREASRQTPAATMLPKGVEQLEPSSDHSRAGGWGGRCLLCQNKRGWSHILTRERLNLRLFAAVWLCYILMQHICHKILVFTILFFWDSVYSFFCNCRSKV